MDIKSDLVWVTILFEDESKRTLHTTMNTEILRKYGGALIVGHLFDVERLEQVAIPEEAEDIRWQETPPEYEREVDRFAARFI